MDFLEDRPFFAMFCGGLLLILIFACFSSILVQLVQDVSLWAFGRRTTAEVIDRWIEPVGGTLETDGGVLDFHYYIQYRFSTSEGRVITNTTTVSAQEWIGVGHGGQGQARNDLIDVREVQPNAPVYREQEHVTDAVAGGLESADLVPVVYFPLHPVHNRLDDSRFVPLMACAYVPLVLLSGAGLVVIWRAIRSLFLGEIRRRKAETKYLSQNNLTE